MRFPPIVINGPGAPSSLSLFGSLTFGFGLSVGAGKRGLGKARGVDKGASG